MAQHHAKKERLTIIAIKKADKVDIIGPDGITRNIKREQRINEVFFHTFKGEAAEMVLNYMRSISLSMVNGPDATDAQLRHREGMRDMMRIVNTRIEIGEREHRQKMET